MPKKTVPVKHKFTCIACLATFRTWNQTCMACGGVSTLRAGETVVSQVLDKDMQVVQTTVTNSGASKREPADTTVGLGEVDELIVTRESCGIESIDEVLGDGMAFPSAILLGAERGCGKTTSMLQTAHAMCARRKRVLMGIGEQSPEAIKAMSLRLGLTLPDRYFRLSMGTDFEEFQDNCESFRPDVFMMDALDNYETEAADGRFGTASQKETIAMAIKSMVHDRPGRWDCLEAPLAIVSSHMNKIGEFRGTTPVEHMLDVCLKLIAETAEKRIRVLCDGKNRFGASDVVRFVRMIEIGLVSVKVSESGDSMQCS